LFQFRDLTWSFAGRSGHKLLGDVEAVVPSLKVSAATVRMVQETGPRK
jgi:hypothetical protein